MSIPPIALALAVATAAALLAGPADPAVDAALPTVRLVTDLNRGRPDGNPDPMVALGGRLLFSATDRVHGKSLWATDGTAAGTTYLARVDGRAAVAGESIAFVLAHGSTYDQLWRTDGTPGGTWFVKSLRAYPALLGTVGDRLLYTDYDTATQRRALWAADGTSAGTVEIAPLFVIGVTLPGGGGYPIAPSARLGGELLFGVAGGSGVELWASDGTSAGTRLVRRIGVRMPSPEGYVSPFGLPVVVGSTVFFAADDGRRGNELWSSDGTEAGTRLVADIERGAGNSDPGYLTAVGTGVFFRAETRARGDELWHSDGTAAGTHLVRDIVPGWSGSGPWGLAALGRRVVFWADDRHGLRRLWRTDGTASGTRTIPGLRNCGSDPAALGPRVILPSQDARGCELWATNGTAAGTRIVRDLNRGRGDSSPGPFQRVGERLYFAASDATHGRELWLVER